ncbi:DUF4158 domain-containing protein [Nocardia sp. CY41]|uniref:DUF4158 domain-containing protein n=1 Tax=Nocardia sp. CY41 TaxID=2608686 RepID=UPI001F3494CC
MRQASPTRTEHLRLVAQFLGWRLAGSIELKELDEFLLARAMERDSPMLLFRRGCEYAIGQGGPAEPGHCCPQGRASPRAGTARDL